MLHEIARANINLLLLKLTLTACLQESQLVSAIKFNHYTVIWEGSMSTIVYRDPSFVTVQITQAQGRRLLAEN